MNRHRGKASASGRFLAQKLLVEPHLAETANLSAIARVLEPIRNEGVAATGLATESVRYFL